MTRITEPLTSRVIGTQVVATHIAYRCERYPDDVNTQFVRDITSQWWQPNMTATIDPSATSEYVRLVDAYPGTPHVKDFAANERRYLRISYEIHGIIVGKTTVADGIIHYNGWGSQVWEHTRSIQLLQIATPSRDGNGLYPVRIALAHIDDIEI